MVSGGSPSAIGAMQFTRDVIEWVEQLVEGTDDHRKGSMEAIGDAVARHEEDLRREDQRNPGWVAVTLTDLRKTHQRFVDQVAEDNAAIIADNQLIKDELKWARRLVVTTLIALMIFFAQQLYVRL